MHLVFFIRPFAQAIFVARQSSNLENRTCKPGAILSAICRRDIAGVSNMFETYATKIASSCRDKTRLCKRALPKWLSLDAHGRKRCVTTTWCVAWHRSVALSIISFAINFGIDLIKVIL